MYYLMLLMKSKVSIKDILTKTIVYKSMHKTELAAENETNRIIKEYPEKIKSVTIMHVIKTIKNEI